MSEPQPESVIILVMGKSGSAKSTFIDLASRGPDRVAPTSGTSNTSTRLRLGTRTVTLVEINESVAAEGEIDAKQDIRKRVKEIEDQYPAGWAGVIYTLPIDDNRFSTKKEFSFLLISHLRKRGKLGRLIIITTVWDNRRPAANGEVPVEGVEASASHGVSAGEGSNGGGSNGGTAPTNVPNVPREDGAPDLPGIDHGRIEDTIQPDASPDVAATIAKQLGRSLEYQRDEYFGLFLKNGAEFHRLVDTENNARAIVLRVLSNPSEGPKSRGSLFSRFWRGVASIRS